VDQLLKRILWIRKTLRIRSFDLFVIIIVLQAPIFGMLFGALKWVMAEDIIDRRILALCTLGAYNWWIIGCPTTVDRITLLLSSIRLR
jgi:hypothetical protein